MRRSSAPGLPPPFTFGVPTLMGGTTQMLPPCLEGLLIPGGY